MSKHISVYNGEDLQSDDFGDSSMFAEYKYGCRIYFNFGYVNVALSQIGPMYENNRT